MAPRSRKVLILGGTQEARQLADLLVARNYPVTTSLAGMTRAPEDVAGQVRLGGFGGSQGLRDYLEKEGIALLADAAHPFAAQISANGVEAAREAGIPLVRLERPPWSPGRDDTWWPARDVAEAASLIPRASKALVTVGRKEVSAFFRRGNIRIVARMIEPPEMPLPDHATLLLARPPFTREQERGWLDSHGIDILVTKNSGGAVMEPKLVAAREYKIPVIMIERPEKPPAETVATAEEMAERIAARLGS